MGTEPVLHLVHEPRTGDRPGYLSARNSKGIINLNLWKIAVKTSSEAADAVAVQLEEFGAVAIDTEDRLDVEIKKAHLQFGEILDEDHLFAPMDGAVVNGYFDRESYDRQAVEKLIDELHEQLQKLQDYGLDPGSLRITFSSLDEEDYLHAWKKDFHAFSVSDRLAIVPVWERDSWRGSDLQLPLYVEPGVAFGTGTHETTRLCLVQLEAMITPGVKVLDVGTGTGILAIAAAKLGASRVVAVDLDETAVRVASANVEDNQVSDVVRVLQSDLNQAVTEETFDVVTANLLAGLVIRLIPEILRHLKKGGCLIASGIVESQWEAVKEALAMHHFNLIEVSREADWLAVCARWEG